LKPDEQKQLNMKKLFLSTCVVLALAGAANAQGFRLGVKAGANLNKIQGQSFNDGYNLGYQFGGFSEIDFGKKIGIQPEVLFSQSKTKYEQNTSAITHFDNLKGGENIRLDYLSIPVLLRINSGDLVTFLVGPQFSIMVNNHQTTAENGQNAFKNGDFAMVGGLQVNLKLLRVYGRYNVGLSDISDITNSDKWKSQQLQLGVGLKL
jgi:hypothetical protein